MRLPEVQEELRDIARSLKRDQIADWELPSTGRRIFYLARQISRRKADRKKPPVRTLKLTYAQKVWVRQQRRAGFTYDWIIKKFTRKFKQITNSGRISEVLRGKRR